MKIRLLFVAAAALGIAACSDSSTAPRTLQPAERMESGLTCKAGYHVATRADGTQYCEVNSGGERTFKP